MSRSESDPIACLGSTQLLIDLEASFLAHEFLGGIVEMQLVVSVSDHLSSTEQVAGGINIHQLHIQIFLGERPDEWLELLGLGLGGLQMDSLNIVLVCPCHLEDISNKSLFGSLFNKFNT